jgi:ParB/RepB/Spo0J family partition protein
MSDSPVLLPIKSLQPHPKNPRLVKREDIISAIEQQIRAAGSFDQRHAITVRPMNGHYEILSGHNRTDAAGRAGQTKIPAWVREMDDESAFMELILSNAQSELSPLERGIHALGATEKGSKLGKSIAAYAEQVGRGKSVRAVQLEVAAATVVSKTKSTSHCSELTDKCSHLAEIHSAPQSCWPTLVQRMVKQSWTVEQTAERVAEIRKLKSPRGYEKLFLLATMQELLAEGEKVADLTERLVRTIERSRADIRSGFAPDHHLEIFELWLAEHGPWDEVEIFARRAQLLEDQKKAEEESEHKAAKMKRAITLAEWKTLEQPEQTPLLHIRDTKAKLIKQSGQSIEWARWSWNPVTGCLHNCPYCYARDIAERFYAQKFEPSIVPAALAAPLNATPPEQAATDLGWKNIFTCSMADLFGNWVPNEWIEAVLSVVREAKDWNFLFLTKFPQRLKDFQFPENAWPGTSVDLQARVPAAEKAMRDVKAAVKWLSIEPLIEPITLDFSLFQWAVIGGASKSSQTPEWKPPRQWVHDLTSRAMAAGCAVYHKDNLNLDRLRDYPGFADAEPTHAPAPFQYLKISKAS